MCPFGMELALTGLLMKRDPPLPAVSFIAGRFSFRATGRGSCIARRALSKLKGLSLSSEPRRIIAEGNVGFQFYSAEFF
jgi:hypothetical protein